jgi:hypothetical protein
MTRKRDHCSVCGLEKSRNTFPHITIEEHIENIKQRTSLSMGNRHDRGMKNGKAGIVRKEGMQKECEFATLIGGRKKGKEGGKTDVICGGWCYSCKKYTKDHYQVFGYRKTYMHKHFYDEELYLLSNKFIEWINVYPNDIVEFNKDRDKYNNMQSPKTYEVAQLLQDINILRKFIQRSFFDDDTNRLAIQQKDHCWNVFDKDGVINIICANVTVTRSEGGRKVVLKIKNDANELITLAELEIRTGRKEYASIEQMKRERHYKELLFSFKAPQLLKLLNDYTENKIIYGAPNEFTTKTTISQQYIQPNNQI